MKFIKLEILNLASLDRQDGETINFEEGALGNSTIFSIIGPTGSGKSTLLDAICLALYNRAPRYPRKRGDRNQNIEIYGELQEGEKNRLAPTDSRNILTRGKKNGYSKLTFLANNGNMYRAEWHVRFLRKTYDNAATHLYVISRKDGHLVEEEAVWDELPQIIGLDYDQFLRTVLIAQGSFANFLTAKEEERYQLLEKLVGCEELYKDIAVRIKQCKDEAVEAYKQIAANASAYEKSILTEEELTALGEKIAQLEAEEKQAKDELEKVNEALTWYTDEEKMTANIAKYQHAFDTAKQQLDGMKPQTDWLRLHDSTLEAVNLFKDIKTCERNITLQTKAQQNLEEDAAKYGQTIKAEQQNLTILQESAKNAAAELDQQKPHINRAREIKTQLQEIAKTAKEKSAAKEEANKAWTQATKAVKKNSDDIKKAEEELAKAVNEQESLIAKIDAELQCLQKAVTESTGLYDAESKKLEGNDITRLQEAKSAAEKKKSDLANGIRIQTNLKEKLANKSESEEKQKQLVERNKEIDELLKTYHLEELKSELSQLTAAYTLMTSENWQMHRAHLQEGKPCPLCGSTAHPYHSEEYVQSVISGQKSVIDRKQRLLDEKTTEQTKLLQEQSKNEGTLKSLEKSLALLAKEIDKLGTEWTLLKQSYPDWQEDADQLHILQTDNDKKIEEATKELTAYNTLVKTVDKLRKAKEAAEKELTSYNETSLQQKEKAEQKKTKATTLLATEKAKTENLVLQEQEKESLLKTATDVLCDVNRQLLEKQKALEVEIGNADPDVLEKQLTTTKETAERNAKAKGDEILKMQGDLQGIHGKIESIRQTKQNEETLQTEKAQALESWLTLYNDKENQEKQLSVDDIAALYASTDDWETIRSRQKAINESFTSARTTLQNEVKVHEEHLPKKPEADKEALTRRKTELEGRSNEELVNAKARLKNHNDAKEKMGSLFQRMSDAETRKKEWEEISDAIGGSDGKQLRKIAQCYTLRFLIEHANDEIRKFNTRYELQQVRNSLGIRVIDHDRADDVRDTTSLSGGETFIVSLGLALGLSALSSRNISFDNLFIDEGFGTLDPDTLTTVIDSLAMLQSSQGKKVGVISHTDTMSERITTQIRIIKNGSGSSHVEIYP
jgi:DNA repair protein SbcC/Rad50